jgi:hypothetical protein
VPLFELKNATFFRTAAVVLMNAAVFRNAADQA